MNRWNIFMQTLMQNRKMFVIFNRHGHTLDTLTRREIGPCTHGWAIGWCRHIGLCQGKTFETIKIGDSSKHRWWHVQNVAVYNLVVGGATVLFWKQVREDISKFLFLKKKTKHLLQQNSNLVTLRANVQHVIRKIGTLVFFYRGLDFSTILQDNFLCYWGSQG